MRMKERFWPTEDWRKPRPIVKAIKAATKAFTHELNRQKHAQKVRELPDPLKEQA